MFNLNKQLTALAFLTVTSAIGTILTVSSISAQPQPSGVVKDVTLWSKPNRQGTTFESNQGVPDLSQVGFDNRASSIENQHVVVIGAADYIAQFLTSQLQPVPA